MPSLGLSPEAAVVFEKTHIGENFGTDGFHGGESAATTENALEKYDRVTTTTKASRWFLQRDPLGYIDGPNDYTYANNNPMLYEDPTGTRVCLNPAVCSTLEKLKEAREQGPEAYEVAVAEHEQRISHITGGMFAYFMGTAGLAAGGPAASSLVGTMGPALGAAELEVGLLAWRTAQAFPRISAAVGLGSSIGLGVAIEDPSVDIPGPFDDVGRVGRRGARALQRGAVDFGVFGGGRRAIGATGRIGEVALRRLGGQSQVFFRTSKGGRFVDQLVRGVAHESKVGRTSLTRAIRRQIAKDVELFQSGQVQGTMWNFFRSPVTGKIGPSGPLRSALEEAGFGIILH